MIQDVESSVDFGIVEMKEVLEHLPDALNKLTAERSSIPFAVRRIASCERGALFHLQVVLGSVTRWYVQYGYYIHGTRNSTENDECVAPLSYFCIVPLLSKPPRSRLNKAWHNVYLLKT
jgi:hypothetical protein